MFSNWILPFAVPYMRSLPSFEHAEAVNVLEVSNRPEKVLKVEVRTRLDF